MTMNVSKLRKPFTSIYDSVDVMTLWNITLGIACFTSKKRSDGGVVHFYDRGDHTFPAIASAVTLSATSMIFFFEYYPMDTTVDDIVFKCVYLFLCLGANLARYLFLKRIDEFLNAFRLMHEIDEELKRRRISVDYEEARKIVKVAMLATLGSVSVLYFLYTDRNISDDIRIYHFINFAFGPALSIGSLCLQTFYQLIIAETIRCRLEKLIDHLVKLQRTQNSKIVEQELLMISVIHFKLCQVWNCILNATGLPTIFMHWIFYMYCLYPLSYLDYILPRMKYEAAPVWILMFVMIYLILNIFEKMKEKGQELKRALVEFNLLKGKSSPIIHRLSTTLLLQMEHVDITLIFGGFFVVDLESLLSGIKSCSVYIMFFLQMNNENMF